MIVYQIKRFIKHGNLFSYRYALYETICHIYFTISKKIGLVPKRYFFDKKNTFILKWLKTFYKDLIKKYSYRPFVKEKEVTPTIWTCWLQGEEEAPFIIKKCIRQIRNMSNGQLVIVITNKNYQKYCNLPSGIVRKYNEGIISAQQLTDIIRARLLSRYGGLWVDATIWLSKSIPHSLFTMPTYSVKGIKTSFIDAVRISEPEKWMSYFIFSQPHSVTYDFIYEALILFWEKYSSLIDYFLIFYLAQIARENIEAAYEEYDNIPINNVNCEMLLPMLSDCNSSDNMIREILTSNTWVYKLSWKISLGKLDLL